MFFIREADLCHSAVIYGPFLHVLASGFLIVFVVRSNGQQCSNCWLIAEIATLGLTLFPASSLLLAGLSLEELIQT